METIGSVPVIPVPRGVRREDEARKARHRLYPSTILYSAYAVILLDIALRRGHILAALTYFFAGIVIWTLAEYLIHRYVLHGRFPDGPGFIQHFLHARFDHLHVEHHQRPWDGNHVNGTLKDTLPFSIVFIILAAAAPLHTAPVTVAGFLLAYVAEEWIHHSVHFCQFKNRYFQFIRRHHMYHHGPKGSELGFGLSNGFWDVVLDTQVPEHVRRRPRSKQERSTGH
jgi:sterol desaturase/sphingolipid hydroxylase (fatty acid hydroxylase superfamily)